MIFQHAITRLPAETFAQGISSALLGIPDISLALTQHRGYVSALQQAGLNCVLLPSLPEFPDSVFVEDDAVIAGESVVITRPGADSRRGETLEMTPVLACFFEHIERIHAPGTLDGGDICQIDGYFIIGVSQRTNLAGANQLADLLRRQGFTADLLDIRGIPGILHLKSAVNFLGQQTILVDPRLKEHPLLQNFRRLIVPIEEAYAANCLRVNDLVLVPDGFPQTLSLVREAGFRTQLVAVSEYQKMDGGLSCLSLRW